MPEELQHVVLRGGSFDGRLAVAPPSPGTLRLGRRLDDEEWSELYMYLLGETEDRPGHGVFPVMVFMERRDKV